MVEGRLCGRRHDRLVALALQLDECAGAAIAVMGHDLKPFRRTQNDRLVVTYQDPRIDEPVLIQPAGDSINERGWTFARCSEDEVAVVDGQV